MREKKKNIIYPTCAVFSSWADAEWQNVSDFRFVSTSYLWSRSSYRWINGGIEGALMRRGNFYESRKLFSSGDKADGEVSSS